MAATATRMALYRYLHHIENAGIDPSLLQSIPSSMLTEVSKEVKRAKARLKKHGMYLMATAEEKVRVEVYRSVNGTRAAIKRSKFI